MNRIILKNIILFLTGFCVYITIECCFRGYSYPLMGACGGLCIVLLDKINDEISWDVDLFWQCMCGSVIVTFMEFCIGMSAKFGMLPVMWDYSEIPYNFEGVVCLQFSIAWMFLSAAAIFMADAINYYVFNDDDVVPYYRLFGKKIITFYEKECIRRNEDVQCNS